jgi:hypothetical protein
MLHACFTPIALCFVYTSWHFYAFFGTNLLLCVPYFLLFLCFRKVTQEIFSELDEMKPEVPIFPRQEAESKEESEGGQEVATPPGGAGAPWARHPVVWDLLVPSNIAPPPI